MKRSGLLALLIVTTTLAGCSATPEPEPPAAEAEAPVEAETPPEVDPTPEPPAEFLAASFTDEDGYTFNVTAYQPGEIEVTIDIANAKPGEAIIAMTVPVSGRLENTTPGRNAYVHGVVFLTPVWDIASPACALWTDFNPISDLYCGTQNSGELTQPPGAPEIPIGESVEITGVAQTFGTERTVPEADVAAIEAALKTPAGWVLAVPESNDSPCRVQKSPVHTATPGINC